MKLKPFKKIWLKKFKQDELESIQEIMLDFSKSYGEHILGEEDLLIPKSFRNKKSTFAYLETDRWDSSEGISPKQLSKLINIWSLENLTIALWCISYLSFSYAHGEIYESDDDEITILSYKELLKHKDFEIFFKSMDDSIQFTLSKILRSQENLEDVQPQVIPLLMELKESGFDIRAFLKKSKDEINDTLIEAWKKRNKFVPKNIILHKLDAELWNKDLFLASLNEIFQIKQFAKLSVKDRKLFLDYFKNAGINSYLVASIFKKDALNLKTFIADIELDEEGFSFLEKMKDQDLSFDEFIVLMKIANSKRIRNIYKETKDIKSLIQIKDFIDLIDFIPIESIIKISKMNFSAANIEALKTLYLETKDLEMNIPIHEGLIDNDYRWEMLKKDNFDSLLAGNFTQCCQRIGGIGSRCLTVGAKLSNTAIFAIYKNDTMICQSYCWQGIKDGENYIVFDSIECVDPNYSEVVTQSYKAYKDKVSDEYTLLSGYIRNVIKNNFVEDQYSTYIRPEDYIPGSYTDAKSQCKLL